MKQNRDKLQLQIRTLEDRLKAKQDEVTNCKQVFNIFLWLNKWTVSRASQFSLKASETRFSTIIQYIQDIVKKMKNAQGEVKFSLEGADEDDLQDEVTKIIIRNYSH